MTSSAVPKGQTKLPPKGILVSINVGYIAKIEGIVSVIVTAVDTASHSNMCCLKCVYNAIVAYVMYCGAWFNSARTVYFRVHFYPMYYMASLCQCF